MSASEYLAHLTPWALWDHYVTYLWNYESTSWVARTASTFRILSVVILLPLASLAFMDIASYIIARTLGIVDDTRASTSDTGAQSISTTHSIPTIQINAPTPEIEQKNEIIRELLDEKEVVGVESFDSSEPHAYFTSEDSNHKLSGGDVFSPAPSTPPSPTLLKKHFSFKEDTGSTTSLAGTTTSETTDSSDDVIHIAMRRR